MFKREYQLTHDIDWFCLLNGIPIHAASNGGIMPRKLCTVEELREIQNTVKIAEDLYDFEINRNVEISPNPYLDDFGDNFYYFFPEAVGLFGEYNLTNSQKAYYWSFVKMAKKGFYSFDKCKNSNSYQIVAWPKQCSYGDKRLTQILMPVIYGCFYFTLAKFIDRFEDFVRHNNPINLVGIINRLYDHGYKLN